MSTAGSSGVAGSSSNVRQPAAGTSTSRWIFTEEQLLKVPSIREGMHPDEELKRRRAAAQTIHQMADRLNHESRIKISQLCICAAMMHMHRFYVFHSFYKFDPRDIAAACLFLAGKSEECPRKLEHVVRVWWALKFPHTPSLDQSRYHDAAQLIVTLENVILQTIAFDLSVDIPHPYVLLQMQCLARGNKRISEIAYWFASDMLHMTNWGVRFSAKAIACVCIQMACSWAEFEIPSAPGSPPWYEKVDPTMTQEKLIELTEEFSRIYKTCGEQLSIKKYMMRNSMRESAAAQNAQGQQRRLQHPQPQGASSSLASLPPPPPAPMLTPNASMKAESKQEPARRIDINDYRQRAGGTGTPVTAHSSTQHSTQRRNFMQPELPQQSSIGDLPLPPAIAVEKATPVLDSDGRQKRRLEDSQEKEAIVKHRRSEKTQPSEGGTSQHRKRAFDRVGSNQSSPAASSLHHSSSSHVTPNYGPSSRHHESSSGSKRQKPSSNSLNQLVSPPLPPQAPSSVGGQRSSLTQSSSTSQQYRGLSHGVESAHRSSGSHSAYPDAQQHVTPSASNLPGSLPPSSSHRHSSSTRMKSREPSASVPPPPPPEAASSGSSGTSSYSFVKRQQHPMTSPAAPSTVGYRSPSRPNSYSSCEYRVHASFREGPPQRFEHGAFGMNRCVNYHARWNSGYQYRRHNSFQFNRQDQWSSEPRVHNNFARQRIRQENYWQDRNPAMKCNGGRLVLPPPPAPPPNDELEDGELL